MAQQAADGGHLVPDGVRLPPRRHGRRFGQATDGLADGIWFPSVASPTFPGGSQGHQNRTMREPGLNQPLHQLWYRLLAQPRSEALDILYVLDH